MKTSVGIAIVAAALVLQPIVVAAADPSPFTAQELDRFVNNFPEYIRFVEKQGEDLEDVKDPNLWQAMKVNRSMQGFFASHGWKPERFFYVASHIAMGMVAVELRHQQPAMVAQMEAARAEIRDNPDLSEEMKQQLLSNLEQIGSAQAEVQSQSGGQIPAEEMALIEANRERLRKTFDRFQ